MHPALVAEQIGVLACKRRSIGALSRHSRNPLMRAENQSSGPAAYVAPVANACPALPFCLVGIGASAAGGLDAARKLVRALVPDAGMAYMLILHLPASHEGPRWPRSFRASPAYRLRTCRTGCGSSATVSTCCLPGYDLEIEDDCLKLKAREAPTGQHRPIDHYFRVLAARQGGNRSASCCRAPAPTARSEYRRSRPPAASLSPRTTRPSRPACRAAPSRPARWTSCSRRRDRRGVGRISGHPYTRIAPEGPFEPPDIRPVLDIMRTHTASTSRSTSATRSTAASPAHGAAQDRRHRRVLGLLQANQGEVEALYQDILINVTSFFRDPDAFDALKAEVFPASGRSVPGTTRAYLDAGMLDGRGSLFDRDRLRGIRRRPGHAIRCRISGPT